MLVFVLALLVAASCTQWKIDGKRGLSIFKKCSELKRTLTVFNGFLFFPCQFRLPLHLAGSSEPNPARSTGHQHAWMRRCIFVCRGWRRVGGGQVSNIVISDHIKTGSPGQQPLQQLSTALHGQSPGPLVGDETLGAVSWQARHAGRFVRLQPRAQR